MKDLSIKKLYYSISEVSKITEVEQYVLRYWESEFELLKPQKNRAGNRIYTNKDIQLILHIKTLLKEKKYTIEGAKKILENYKPETAVVRSESEAVVHEKPLHVVVPEVRKERNSLKKDLEELRTFLQFMLSKI